MTSERFFEQEGDQLGRAMWFVTRERFEAEESTHVQYKPRSSDRPSFRYVFWLAPHAMTSTSATATTSSISAITP